MKFLLKKSYIMYLPTIVYDFKIYVFKPYSFIYFKY